MPIHVRCDAAAHWTVETVESVKLLHRVAPERHEITNNEFKLLFLFTSESERSNYEYDCIRTCALTVKQFTRLFWLLMSKCWTLIEAQNAWPEEPRQRLTIYNATRRLTIYNARRRSRITFQSSRGEILDKHSFLTCTRLP